MDPYYQDNHCTIYHGDCLDVIPGLEAISAIVSDPPYGIEFMGREWDKGVPGAVFWKEMLAVMTPGAHLLSFGGTRTYHRLICAIEDAGFEIRDCLMWLYGSGFPKSLDISKAIDKEAGADREVVGEYQVSNRFDDHAGSMMSASNSGGNKSAKVDITAPATPDAEHWQGWGTALKPSYEPICLARKPFKKSVVKNVLEHGTGGINVDGCRIASSKPVQLSASKGDPFGVGKYPKGEGRLYQDRGRWPANVMLTHHPECEKVGMKKIKGCGRPNCEGKLYSAETRTKYGKYEDNIYKSPHTGKDGLETVEDWNCHPDCPVRLLDEQSGELTSGVLKPYKEKHKNASSYKMERDKNYTSKGSSGGASRFFYTAKASKADRSSGGLVDNIHPTVKPVDLLKYLIRLITPPGGIVLDPFMGSGSTLYAAKESGFKAIGIELEEKYCETASRRLAQEVFDFG